MVIETITKQIISRFWTMSRMGILNYFEERFLSFVDDEYKLCSTSREGVVKQLGKFFYNILVTLTKHDKVIGFCSQNLYLVTLR